MRLWLTGAAGFVGRHLARRLAEDGHEVIGTDLSADPFGGWTRLDLRDRPAVIAALAEARPDLVLHAGAISGPMLARGEPALMFDVNVTGTLSVLEAMRRADVPRLVHFSSNAVYRDRPDREPVGEDWATGKSDPYGASKVAAEAIVACYAASVGIDAWMLRIASIYGPGRTSPYLVSDLIAAGRSGGSVVVTDERSNMRQFAAVEDVVEAVAAAVGTPAGGCVPVNITGGEYLSEAAIGAMVQTHLPALRLDVVAEKGENGDGAIGPLDLARARDRLGYRPAIPIAVGIARLVGGA